ncbi:MAG: LysM peptidoglycan-binding domain-containing protein [Gaiellaceae bacterium]
MAAPLAFFFAATVLVILVQRALESDSGEAGTDGPSTERVDTGPATTVPGTTTTALPRACNRQRYRVRSGDTLESISEKCDVSVAELLELNPNVDPLTLNPGDRIRIRPAPTAE